MHQRSSCLVHRTSSGKRCSSSNPPRPLLAFPSPVPSFRNVSLLLIALLGKQKTGCLSQAQVSIYFILFFKIFMEGHCKLISQIQTIKWHLCGLGRGFPNKYTQKPQIIIKAKRFELCRCVILKDKLPFWTLRWTF